MSPDERRDRDPRRATLTPPGVPAQDASGGVAGSRLYTDAEGVEWEVYDDAQWSVARALEWDYLPQQDDPGLLFVSPRERRRLYPCPPEWRGMTDAQLDALCRKATPLI